MGDKDGQTGGKQSLPAGHDKKEEKCPCTREDNTSLWIFCEDCSQWLHCNCVGLKGLNTKALKTLSEWKCPKCILSPYFSEDSSTDEASTKGDLAAACSVMRDAMKKEISMAFNSLKDTVKEAAEHAVKKATPTVVSGVVEQTKTYAAAAKDHQRELVEEVKSVTTSSQLVNEICKKIDNDSVQRERRKSNIMVSSVPEPDTQLTGAEKREADIIYMCKNFEMERNEIINCYRTGEVKTDGAGKPIPRPIIAVMMDEECARYWHNEGKGYKIGSSWINPDLCRADREKQFFVRQERRKKKEEAAKTPVKK